MKFNKTGKKNGPHFKKSLNKKKKKHAGHQKSLTRGRLHQEHISRFSFCFQFLGTLKMSATMFFSNF